MAEDLQEALRRADEARRAEKDAKELAEKREHELRVAKTSARATARATVLAALITAAATIIAAFITVFLKADQAGQKINNSVGAPDSTINNIRTGLRTFGNLSNPDVPLTAVLPHAAFDKTPPTAPSPVSRPAIDITPPSIPADLGADSETLKRCSGAEPLQFSRVFISSNGSGYRVAIKLTNPSTTNTISILDQYGHRGVTLSSNRATGNAQTGLQEEPGELTRGDANEGAQERAFQMGLPIGPGTATTITADYRDNNATAIQGNLNTRLFYVIKDADGKQSTVNRSLTCDALPIYAVPKQ